MVQFNDYINYPYFKKYYKLIAIYLNKQQKLEADPKAIQQIIFTGNLTRAEGGENVFHYCIVKLYNSQLNKSKSGIKNGTGVILNLSSNLIGNSNDGTNFLHKSLLTDTQACPKLLQMVHQLI